MTPAEERIELVVGDLAALRVDALVNAADAGLLGGGEVDGALHRAAGPRLRAHCLGLGGCPVGEAVLTPAFDLEARGVRALIHAVGPVWGTDPHADGTERVGYRLEDHQLARCYVNALELAAAAGLATVAFPAISTGAAGFPKARAARIAVGHVKAVLARAPGLRVAFACLTAADAAPYEAELQVRRFDVGLVKLTGLPPER